MQDEGRWAQEAAAEWEIVTSQPAYSSQPPPRHVSSARRTPSPRPASHEASPCQPWRLKLTCVPPHTNRKMKPDTGLSLVSFFPRPGEERAAKRLRQTARKKLSVQWPPHCRSRGGAGRHGAAVMPAGGSSAARKQSGGGRGTAVPQACRGPKAGAAQSGAAQLQASLRKCLIANQAHSTALCGLRP